MRACALGLDSAHAWPPLAISSVDDPWQQLNDTFISAGSDISNATMTTDDARVACAGLPDCLGFTYNSASGPGPAYDMLLKSSDSTGSGAGWVTYLKPSATLLAHSFGSSMVLQHDAPCLWGYGVAGAAVSVVTDADGGAAHGTVAAANGTWRLCLPAMSPGGPWGVNVSVAGSGDQMLTDVLFGEVWLASGQSNAAFTVSQAYNASAECAAAAAFTNLRVFSVAQGGSASPQTDFGPQGVRLPWSRVSAGTICGGDFDYLSAVGYFFARDLHVALGTGAMPVGLIVSSVPGTPIEAWAPPEVLTACGIGANNSQLWNKMIVPLLGVSIRGAIWYQGESNEADESCERRSAKLCGKRAACRRFAATQAPPPPPYLRQTPAPSRG